MTSALFPLLSFAATLALFVGLSSGVAWPLAARLAIPAPEKLLATVTLSLLINFLGAWLIFVAAWPLTAIWALTGLAVVGFVAGWRSVVRLAADPDVRRLLVAQALVTGWCVAWLACVVTYSGGGWAADWYEHWERTRFFLEHGPTDTKFLASYALSARPPLANIVTGEILTLTRIDFAHYQFVSTLFASLVFLPTALLARRWGGPRAIGLVAVLVMVNPLFVQNATFAWTKLPAAFFVVAALYFFLRAQDQATAPSVAYLAAASLAAGTLTHYSAAPYAVLLVCAWLVLGRPRWGESTWRRTTLGGAAVAALISATWFGWSLATYGTAETFLSNSSVTSSDARSGNQAAKIAGNIFDSVVPHFVRSFDKSLVAQQSAWGAWRDWFFQSYQLNLLFAFGSLAWLVVVREIRRAAVDTGREQRAFWAGFVPSVILLGIAVHGQRDHWGLAHICLQALVLIGIALLGARWDRVGHAWQRVVVIGATLDLVLGIALQFGVESFAFERWFAPGRTLQQTFVTLSEPAQMNLLAKVEHRLVFFGDIAGADSLAIAVVLITLFTLALWSARPVERSDGEQR